MNTSAAETSTMQAHLMTILAAPQGRDSAWRPDARSSRRLDSTGIAGLAAAVILLIAMLPGLAGNGDSARTGAPAPLAAPAPALVVGG